MMSEILNGVLRPISEHYCQQQECDVQCCYEQLDADGSVIISRK